MNKIWLVVDVLFFFFSIQPKKLVQSVPLSCHFLFVSCLKPLASHFHLLSLIHSFLQLCLFCNHQNGSGQASWRRLKRRSYRPAPPLHLSFSPHLKHGPCQCTGWIYHSPSLPFSLSLSPSLPLTVFLLLPPCTHAGL